MNRQEFSEWRKGEIYQEMWKDIVRQIEIYAAEIVNREYPDNDRDQLVRGRIQGLSSVVDWVPEFPPEPEEIDEDEV